MNIEKLRAVQKAINEAWVSLEAATSPKPMSNEDREIEATYALWIQARMEGISTYFHGAYSIPQIDQGLTTPEAVEKTYDNLYRDVRIDDGVLYPKCREWLLSIFL